MQPFAPQRPTLLSRPDEPRRLALALLLFSTIALTGFGLVMLYSTSYAMFGPRYMIRQSLWIAGGGFLVWITARIGHERLIRWGPGLLLILILALAYLGLAAFLAGPPLHWKSLAAHFPFVRRIKGAYRWLRIGPVTLQPSEFAAPLVSLYLAGYYHRYARKVERFWGGFVFPAILPGAAIVLILLGRNLSMTLITGSLVMVLMFVAGVRLRYLLLLIALGVGVLYGVVAVSPVRAQRFLAYRNPEKFCRKQGYQLWHSEMALGDGGMFGVGFTRSRMKQKYLPEAHTDFILAIVGEEFGFMAMAGVIALYALTVLAILLVGALAADRSGTLLCTGVGTALAAHAFVNLGVISGLLPTTGVTAPFISYGGSSMLASAVEIGLVFGVYRHAVQSRLSAGREAQWTPAAFPGGSRKRADASSARIQSDRCGLRAARSPGNAVE